MTGHNSRQDPAALIAARHIQEFGFTGWHLRKRKGDCSPADSIIDDKTLLERQIVQAGHYVAEEFPERDNTAVFLIMGAPRPEAGDGLVALTRHWLVEKVATLHSGNGEAVYAVLCV